MLDTKQKLDRALQQKPDYRRLDNLSADVWERVQAEQQQGVIGFHTPLLSGIGRLSIISLCLIALLAISQVFFQPGNMMQPDLFDLRYFSHQAAPSLNFASVNTYGFTQ